ncbi:GAF and ANTAR domain-containing protein [uncultured Microbacterium sp.]|uniref:GAF and ANTAR domain-containing protein n=1 Tax=uncultured Microbacterium sp. TaxID=191216 RepID=UPI0025F9D3C7|nr:GAF and ANTAR domain-containing protein [uncultured Microbacterium sp.]
MSGSFSDTLDLLHSYAGDESLLAEIIARPFPVSGATVTLGGVIAGATVSATGPVAARLDELQLDLGEGPLWDATRTGKPVLEPDLYDHPQRSWPALFDALVGEEEVRALFSFPLRFHHLLVGTITLYCNRSVQLFPDEIRQMATIADVVSRVLMRLSLERSADGEELVPDRFSRRSIHQATGMVIVQAGVSAEDAELLIRGQAFAHDTTMRHVADDILHRRVVFDAVTMGREDR